MSASQEIVVRRSTNVAALPELKEALLTGKRVEMLDDPETISRAILEQLLAASSDAELEPTQPIGWRELVDVPIEVQSFTWRNSDYDEEGSSSVYVVVFGTRLDAGEPVTLTTGARNVLAQLCNLAERDRLPIVRAIKESEKLTANGYRPLWLYTPDGYVREGDVIDEVDET